MSKVTAWLNKPTKPNKNWSALLSAVLGGVSAFVTVRRDAEIERRLRVLEAIHAINDDEDDYH